MYITYETAQYSLIHKKKLTRRSQPPITIPNDLPKTDFMPTKLVRISDMTVVDGSQVNEGYCALSYSWNQSGDILLDENTGKYKRIDEGKHKIISYDNIYPDMIIPRYKAPIDYKDRAIGIGSKLEKMYYALEIIDDKNYYFTKTTKQVKFEGIIQQICQQFNINYIWYDQLCINQNNKEEKKREIRNMHHIYENAYCTVALVPEYCKEHIIYVRKQQYFKRLWTLEEAIKSKRLLFVGRDKYQCGDEVDILFDINQLIKPLSQLNVAQILYHAHHRTSTDEHDRVFALIQLFPEFIDKINIDYDQKLEDLMIRFYGLLAKKDISILFFLKTIDDYESTIKKYKFLPSWTGVNGEHFMIDITKTTFQNYDIIGKTMHVTTAYATNDQCIDDDNLTIREEDIPPIPDDINDDNLTIREEDIPPNPDDINDDGDKRKYRLCILVQLSETNEMKRISLNNYGRNFFFDEISEYLQQLSRFMEIKKENFCWCHKDEDDYQNAGEVDFYLTDSLDDPSAQHFILSEVWFDASNPILLGKYYYYPVIKKEQGEEFYKAIGCCRIISNKDFFSDCNLNKETFLIQ